VGEEKDGYKESPPDEDSAYDSTFTAHEKSGEA
jgi:hypothetical protein